MSTFRPYNVVVFGEPAVGKTCFIDQFCFSRSFVAYDLDDSTSSHEIIVDGRVSKLALMDLSTSFLKPEQSMHPTNWAEKMLAEADAVVLLYDITSSSSFEYLINQAYDFLWECRRRSGVYTGKNQHKSFGCVLVGNKYDVVSSGQKDGAVSQNLADEWAQTQGFRSIVVDSLTEAGPESALRLLMKNVQKLERMGLLEARSEMKHEEEVALPKIQSSIRKTIRGIFNPSST
ncbi:hypothetical protein SVAN01_08126 [Stagonosporopsis vannaccii]|nr:hypothetical protein SVAN01_08126 [Stagonosporopsis vannaccii]